MRGIKKVLIDTGGTIENCEIIQFTITNNSDCTLNVPMFTQNVYSINATQKYSWLVGGTYNIYTVDDTNVYGALTTCPVGNDFSCGVWSIVINGVTLPVTFNGTLKGALGALNALGYGFFCYDTMTTTTTTTTTAIPPTYNFNIQNLFSKFSASDIVDVQSSSIYSIVTGSFPITNGSAIQATHTGFATALSVSIAFPSATSTLDLYKNAVLQETIPVPSTGIYTFSPVNFLATDICLIQFNFV